MFEYRWPVTILYAVLYTQLLVFFFFCQFDLSAGFFAGFIQFKVFLFFYPFYFVGANLLKLYIFSFTGRMLTGCVIFTLYTVFPRPPPLGVGELELPTRWSTRSLFGDLDGRSLSLSPLGPPQFSAWYSCVSHKIVNTYICTLRMCIFFSFFLSLLSICFPSLLSLSPTSRVGMHGSVS